MTLKTAQQYFFDREAVQARMDAKMLRVLRHFGGSVRLRDYRSLRYRKRPSQPGEPPSVHRGSMFKTNKRTGIARSVSLLKESLVYVLDETTGNPSVVIGPTLANGSKPGLLRTIEEGGEVVSKDKLGRAVRRQHRARPHTGPAFTAAIRETLPKLLGTE